MENLIKGPIPGMMTAKPGPPCKGELEINLSSETFEQGHLHDSNLTSDYEAGKSLLYL